MHVFGGVAHDPHRAPVPRGRGGQKHLTQRGEGDVGVVRDREREHPVVGPLRFVPPFRANQIRSPHGDVPFA